MKRYHIHVFVPGHAVPVNTYVTDSVETVCVTFAKLMTNQNSGLARIEVQDATKSLPLLVMSPYDLDQPRQAESSPLRSARARNVTRS